MKKILCVCIGNGDRSPFMQVVLQMLLKNAGHDVTVESAGVEVSSVGGSASPFAVAAAARIGLDLSKHTRQQTTSLDLTQYDLVVTVSDEVAGKLANAGVPLNKIHNANIANPWPVNFPQQYTPTAKAVMGAMYEVMELYRNSPNPGAANADEV